MSHSLGISLTNIDQFLRLTGRFLEGTVVHVQVDQKVMGYDEVWVHFEILAAFSNSFVILF